MAHLAAPPRDPGDLTPADLLRAAEHEILATRRSEVRQYELLLAWADLHSGDPQDQPGAVPVRHGGPKLIYPGRDGTPGVVDLCLPEIAVARDESPITCRNTLRVALDLRHRFPATWAQIQALVLPVWVGRQITHLARDLTLEQAVVVDTAVADAAAQGPGRVLEIAEAKVIEADPDAHRKRLELAARTRGVWLHRPRAGEERLHNPGVAMIIARLETGDADAFDATITEIAALLEEHADPDQQPEGEPHGTDHWRSEAFALLADPAAALSFLARCHDLARTDHAPDTTGEAAPPSDAEPAADEGSAPEDHLAGTTESAAEPVEVEDTSGWTPITPAPGASSPFHCPPRTRGTARLFVHLALGADGQLAPLARVEGLGPVLASQLADLLRHHDITLTPVIDLHEGRSVNGYEHPTDVRERVTLRTAGSVFPHATDLTRQAGRPPTSTTSSPTNATDHPARPATTTPRPCSGWPIAPRRTWATRCTSSARTAGSGARPTASPGSSTRPAPTTSVRLSTP
ncbi:hypothetical protein [Nocardioides nanhaiensis]|uniref:DUF222 domain-containing protein n=1 Tax=Nocardioides nanhaiensis TaxID=1476871 RepID=A0ABP8WIH9_9ACTN